MKVYNTFSMLALALTLMLAPLVVNAADVKPSGTIKITETEVMAVIGGSKGTGTLNFDGSEYEFIVSGASVGASVGVQKLHIAGEVYHLSDVVDLAGVYFQMEAGVSFIEGVSGMWLQNKKGVTLHLKSEDDGAALVLGSGGLKIAME